MKAAVMALLLAASSCSLFGPTVACDESDLGEAMSCARVMAAAQSQLAQLDGITLLSVAVGLPCDFDSLSCGPDVPRGSVSTVYADLADGRRIGVPVHVEDDGLLRAGPLQEMSPSP